jgi:prepilin-type N-terminal cleavage/methylation domain-containing protein
MEPKNVGRNEQGFTLVEIIAVLVILGIVAVAAIPKYIDMSVSAKARVIDAAVADLNLREIQCWADAKLSPTGWTADTLPADTDLGADFTWDAGDPTIAGGGLMLQGGDAVELDRTASTTTSPGKWARR